LRTSLSGDRVNFGLAAERVRAKGVQPLEMLFTADDCALASADRSAGRRGLAGNVLVLKVAGALSEQGKDLAYIVNYLKKEIMPNLGTMGLALGPCWPPGAEQPTFSLPQGHAGLGLGIHGEAGVKTIPLKSAKEAVLAMLNHMILPQSVSRLDVKKNSKVVLLVNNLGGTSAIEVNLLTLLLLMFLYRWAW